MLPNVRSSSRRPIDIVRIAVATLVLTGCAQPPSPVPSSPGSIVTPSRGSMMSDRNSPSVSRQGPDQPNPLPAALQCMDDLLFANGIYDVTLLQEEFRDGSPQSRLGTRAMFSSALAAMTRRSRAVHLSALGAEHPDLTQLLKAARQSSGFDAVPRYIARGAISQVDESVPSAAPGLWDAVVDVFRARPRLTNFQAWTVDAVVVQSTEMTNVAGVNARSSAVMVRQFDQPGDGEARIRNPNLEISLQAAPAQGANNVIRSHVELTAIELVGKLVRVPYWQCLGVRDDHVNVKRELDDWFDSLEPDELIKFVKKRLRERRYYDGDIDGLADERLKVALRSYQQVMGRPEVRDLDKVFFAQFIVDHVPRGPHARVRPEPRKPPPPVAVPAPRLPASSPSAEPPSLSPPPTPEAEPASASLTCRDPASSPLVVVTRQLPGSGRAKLTVTTRENGYVYCYRRDSAGKFQRFFPNGNANSDDSYLSSGVELTLPASGDVNGVLEAQHQHACIFAPLEFYGDLPSQLRWPAFQNVRAESFEDICVIAERATGVRMNLTVAAPSSQ